MQFIASPPTQGAWIEIPYYIEDAAGATTSPPTQGAWIEIIIISICITRNRVAPYTGGVD